MELENELLNGIYSDQYEQILNESAMDALNDVMYANFSVLGLFYSDNDIIFIMKKFSNEGENICELTSKISLLYVDKQIIINNGIHEKDIKDKSVKQIIDYLIKKYNDGIFDMTIVRKLGEKDAKEISSQY